jgi:hypothetical protein
MHGIDKGECVQGSIYLMRGSLFFFPLGWLSSQIFVECIKKASLLLRATLSFIIIIILQS